MRKKGQQPRFTEHVSLPVPSVWRDGGYLALLFKVLQDDWHDEARYFSMCNATLLKKQKRPPSVHVVPASVFERRMSQRREDICPHRYALHILAGLRNGLYEMRVKDERSIVAMLDQQQLMKMTGSQLAVAYKKVMGSGPAKIPDDEKEQRVAEILSKVQENAALAVDVEDLAGNGEDVTAEESSSAELPGEGAMNPAVASNGVGKRASRRVPPPSAMKPKAKKEAAKKEKAPKAAKVTKEKAPKPKAAKEKAPKKEKALKPAKPKRAAGEMPPIREGTMKDKCWKLFQKGGDRDKLLKSFEGLGATPSTARGWYQNFRQRTVKAA